MVLNLQDAALGTTITLPNGAAATNSGIIDLGIDAGQALHKGDFTAQMELVISAPALGVTPLKNGKTMVYSVSCSDNANGSAPRLLADNLIVQTGANGAGAAAASARFRLPTDVRRYVFVTATGNDTGDASGSTATVAFVF